MIRSLAFVLVSLAGPAAAHEFWIAPVDYLVPADTTVEAYLVNGEDFEGPKVPYLPQRFDHFVIYAGGAIAPVQSRVGDNPALSMTPTTEGLHVVAYKSKSSTVDYATWEKFQRFVDHKDFGDVLARHQARNLPLENFTEIYSRFSKSLIGVGNAAGADRRLGLETEIVALTNPYTDDLSNGMRFQLFYGQDVRADVRFEVFVQAPDGTVTTEFYRTDADGVATVPVKPGHTYMADAVVLREPTPAVAAASDAVWETLWANMTWAVPE